MRTRIFCLLLLVTGGIMFAQTSATKSLSISVTPPPSQTGNLLTGKTPANYTLPAGWSVLCTQDFEGSLSTCTQGSAPITEPASQSSATAHSGTKSGAGSPYGGPGQTKWGTTVPGGWAELYQSWYEQRDAFPGGVGMYFSGADFWFSEVRGDFISTVVAWCCSTGSGTQAGAFGFSNGPLHFVPQYWGTPPADLSPLAKQMGNFWADFDAPLWHQWEIRFKRSTQSCSPKDAQGGCADGALQVWHDGQQWASYSNIDNAGPAAYANAEQYLAGRAEVILWAKNPSILSGGQTACNQVWSGTLDGGVFQCGTSIGDGYGCDTSYFSGGSFSAINAKCPGAAPPHTFNRYIDDVIVLYK
jgi:hypothetical protein